MGRFWGFSGEGLARTGDLLSLFRPGKGITLHLPVYRFPDLAVELQFSLGIGNHGDKSGCKGFFPIAMQFFVIPDRG